MKKDNEKNILLYFVIFPKPIFEQKSEVLPLFLPNGSADWTGIFLEELRPNRGACFLFFKMWPLSNLVAFQNLLPSKKKHGFR
jgi:hypothetical protein